MPTIHSSIINKTKKWLKKEGIDYFKNIKHREMMELRKYNEKMSFLKKIINKLKNNKMS
jgi:hypothetical protein